MEAGTLKKLIFFSKQRSIIMLYKYRYGTKIDTDIRYGNFVKKSVWGTHKKKASKTTKMLG